MGLRKEWEEAAHQRGHEEGRVEGRRDGLREGHREGRREGVLHGRAEMFLKLYRLRFGDVPAEVQRASIDRFRGNAR